MDKETIKSQSPYKRGADNGAIFGLLLVAMFFSMVMSVNYPIFSMITALLFISVPFVIYRFLRRSYIADFGMSQISSLWMQGIMTFACGSLICGIVAAVYLKWIDPDFIHERIGDAIRFYRESGLKSGEELADTLQAMVKANLMPTAVQIVVEIIWLSIFSGSLLSLLMALLARARSVPDTNKR